MTAVVADPAAVAASVRDWLSLVDVVAGCIACPELAASRTQVVPGQCPTRSASGVGVLLVGEAPGAAEDESGVPFVGKSGQLLDSLLTEAGLARDQVAVANVLKCRPPGNRKPTRAEVTRCRPWLQRQIELVNPRVLVALGGTAAEWFHGPGARIAALREAGRAAPLTSDGRVLVVTYHPSAANRFGPGGAPIAALREDLATVARLVEELS